MPPTKKKNAHPKVTISDHDLKNLMALCHGDPHSILGLHPEKKGVRIRVFRPDALSVSIMADGKGKEVPLSPCQPSGFFEALLEGAKEAKPYRVRVEYPDKKIFTYWDPFAFWPTLGDMDIYLLGEGNHEKLHEKLGAHFLEASGSRRRVLLGVGAGSARGSVWWGISTAGMGGFIPCGAWVPREFGKSSFLKSARE